MAAEAYAARLHDPVAHSHALGGFLAGAAVGLAAAIGAAVVIGAVVGAVALEVGTAGLATPLVIGVAATVGEFGLNAVVGGKLMGLAEEEGEKLGSSSMGATSGQVSDASPDVFINGIAAARALDAESCDAGKVAQGSLTVGINGRGAARVGDKCTCGAVITHGSPNVLIGGPTGSFAGIQSEVPAWARWAVVVVSILPALGGLARVIGPALAEVEATGISRALQTGVKALGRAMEERGGGARPPDPAKLAAVKALPPGSRPPPGDYLSPSYTDAHLAKFKDGATLITPTSNLDRFGRDAVGRPDGVFVMPSSEADALVARTGGDTSQMESELGVPAGSWSASGSTLSRIDVADPNSLNLRMASGNEEGANALWLPGGQTPNNGSEAVVDQIPQGSYTETVIGGK